MGFQAGIYRCSDCGRILFWYKKPDVAWYHFQSHRLPERVHYIALQDYKP